jgi:Amt family ammonium transporter
VLAGSVCYFACHTIKDKLGIDDTLDVFAVHGVGGIMGSILVAFVGVDALGGTVTEPMKQFGTQVLGVGATAVWSVVGTLVVVMIIKATVGLRASEEDETEGLDQAQHGEAGYSFD